MNKKLISCLTIGMLVSSLMVGCSSSSTEDLSQVHMTEAERVATLQGLEGTALTEAYKKLLTVEEIQYLNENGCNIEEEAEYYQDGVNLKIPQNYNGNEEEAEKYIATQMNESTQEHTSIELINLDRMELSWTNNTGNDIDLLQIDFRAYDEDGQSDTGFSYEKNIASGETRKIVIYPFTGRASKIEVISVDIRHVAQDKTHYAACLPGKWYKLEEQPITGKKEGNEKATTTKQVKQDKTTKTETKEEVTSTQNNTQKKNAKEITKKETHKCSICGVNATKYNDQWLCDNCYEDKRISLKEANSLHCNWCGGGIDSPINGENLCDSCYKEMQDMEKDIYCKGCGVQMNDNNGGTYACDECLGK